MTIKNMLRVYVIGRENTKDRKVIITDLAHAVVYNDGNLVLAPNERLVPSQNTREDIEPNKLSQK